MQNTHLSSELIWISLDQKKNYARFSVGFLPPQGEFFFPPKETYGLWKEWSIWNKNTLWKWWKMSVKIKMISVSSFFSIETEFCRVWCLHIMTYYTKTQHNHTQIRTILFSFLVCLICYHRCISEISDPYFKKLKNQHLLVWMAMLR